MVFMAIGAAGCNELPDTGFSNATAPAMECLVTGSEGSDSVTVLIQHDGVSGQQAALLELDSVLVDGQPLRVDSTELGGVYYEGRFPKDDFTGKHTIRLRSIDGASVTDTFSFREFATPAGPMGFNKGDSFIIRTTGTRPMERVLVVLADTAFATDDLVAVDTLRNGKLVLAPEKMYDLQPGPLTLQLTTQYRGRQHRLGRTAFAVRVEYSLFRELPLGQ